MIRLALLGNPVSHSKSPLIHNFLAKLCSVKLSYELIQCTDLNFEIYRLRRENYRGVNITIPFKTLVPELADIRSRSVEMSRVANTLLFDEHMHAFNTDGPGLVKDIFNKGFDLRGARVLLIGAGGAARGVILDLLSAGVKSLTVTNRTAEKAKQLLEIDSSIIFEDIGDLTTGFDVIINATSSSLLGVSLPVSSEIFCGSSLVYDMFYPSKEGDLTIFLKDALDKVKESVVLADGSGMLIQQAILSFKIWTGLDVPENVSRKEIGF